MVPFLLFLLSYQMRTSTFEWLWLKFQLSDNHWCYPANIIVYHMSKPFVSLLPGFPRTELQEHRLAPLRMFPMCRMKVP